MKRRSAALAASAMTAASVALAADSAGADLVTLCVGTGGAVTVPGDLVVPAGRTCSLDGTTVNGDVRVARDADLLVAGGTFNGAVRVGRNGYLDVTGSTVDGQIVLASGGFGVFVQDSQVNGRVFARPQGRQAVAGFVFIERTTVTGSVVSRVGEVRLDGAEVEGAVSTDGTFYTDLHRTFVDGRLAVRNSEVGSVVCTSAVRGAATFSGNGGGVQLGPNGTLDSCAGGGFWGRDVEISGTTGVTHVDDNIISGTLTFSGNDPIATLAPTNVIRGGVTGDHQAPAAVTTLGVPNRADALAQRASDRRTQAEQAATKAGPARL